VPSEGTYLSELRPPRTKDGPPIVVRVIEDSVITDNDDGEQVSELFFLATTLLDPQGAPAADLAGLYHNRWQTETGISDLKTTQRGSPEVLLHSTTPAIAAQEYWAMVCVDQVVPDLVGHPATPGLDPSQISVTPATEATRDSTTRAAPSPHRNSPTR
jgi:hypothetical protein